MKTKTQRNTAAQAATKTKTITLHAQIIEKAAAKSGRTPAEEVAQMYQTLTGRKTEARLIGTKNGVATFEIATQGAAKGNGYWRKTRRNGERVLIAPDGRIFHGTAQEVRDAAMTPHRRGALAQHIEWTRHTADLYGYTPEQTAEAVREDRREALMRNDADAVDAYHAYMKPELGIVAEAAARYMGQTIKAFIADAVDAAVRGTIDLVELDAGKPGVGLPLTRHERAALDRIKRDKARILAERGQRRAEFDAAQAAKIAKREARATA
jgi:hypothetical protein